VKQWVWGSGSWIVSNVTLGIARKGTLAVGGRAWTYDGIEWRWKTVLSDLCRRMASRTLEVKILLVSFYV
jgi:hypothetical protein